MLLKLTKHQRPDISKRYLNLKDPFELVYQQKRKKNLKTFIDYLEPIDDVYENLKEFNTTLHKIP